MPISEPYSELGWCVTDSDYSENKVIAAQNNCPQELLLKEFMAFGNLRCAKNLQWRHLIRYFSDLNTADISVLHLILTAIHKCEASVSDSWIGDAHVDLLDPSFVVALVKFLEEMIENQKDNWKDYNSMMCLVFICRRLATVNDNGVVLLCKIRHIMSKWHAKLTKLLSSSKEESIIDLQIVSIHVYIITCLTFGFDTLNPGSYFTWLTAVVGMKEKCLLSDFVIAPMYAHMIHFIGYDILPQLDNATVLSFIGLHYSNMEYTLVSKCHQIFQFQANRAIILVDTIYGSFKVNGNPIGYLSKEISQDLNYKVVFGNKKWAVREYKGGFITTETHYNSYYTFTLVNGTVQIREIRGRNSGNRREFVFLPMASFEHAPFEIQDLLAWFNVEKNEVDFRKERLVKYTLADKFISTSNSKRLIQRDTPSYNQIMKEFTIIELPEHIRIYYWNKIEIFLPRYKLHFEVRGDSYYCNELGMSVCNTQLKTFIGLHNKMVLENTLGDLCVIIPHGPLLIKKTQNHVRLMVNMNKLYEPAY